MGYRRIARVLLGCFNLGLFLISKGLIRGFLLIFFTMKVFVKFFSRARNLADRSVLPGASRAS